MPERVTITITGDGGPLADVVARLEEAGVTVERVLEAIGVIVGSVPDGDVRVLAGIRGVGSVEPDRAVQLPPPEADVQ